MKQLEKSTQNITSQRLEIAKLQSDLERCRVSIAAADVTLDSLRQEKQGELGASFLGKRTLDTAAIDERIEKHEKEATAARAAAEILEKRIDGAAADLSAMEDEQFHEAATVCAAEFEAGEVLYTKALDMMREAVSRMTGARAAGERFDKKALWRIRAIDYQVNARKIPGLKGGFDTPLWAFDNNLGKIEEAALLRRLAASGLEC